VKDTDHDNHTLTLTILGSGTSTGVPMSGCACEVCSSSDSRDKRLRTSALISYAGKNILIDAGPDFRAQSLRENIPSIDALLFTHAHADHIMGIDDLRPYYFKQRKAIPCYGSAQTLEQIRTVFFYIFVRDPNYQGGGVAELALHTLVPGAAVEIFGLPIIPFLLEHGNMPVLGYRFGNIAYATDCRTVPNSSRDVIRGVDHLILTGLRYEPHPTHMNISEACAIATELAVPHTYLIHMSHAVGHQATSENLPPHVELSYDGMRISGKV
jgi:phosphoribosyl 1,2-cyclic phosphate phosphodiesterase